MQLIGLENISPEMVYKIKRICHVHFTANCTSPGTKKPNANAYPTLYMAHINDTLLGIYT
jgi:hypothetical protein